MITGINESETLTKHKCYDKKCNSGQWWNNDKCQCEVKNVMYERKIMFGIL